MFSVASTFLDLDDLSASRSGVERLNLMGAFGPLSDTWKPAASCVDGLADGNVVVDVAVEVVFVGVMAVAVEVIFVGVVEVAVEVLACICSRGWS